MDNNIFHISAQMLLHSLRIAQYIM